MDRQARLWKRRTDVVVTCVGIALLVGYRAAIELGLGPPGSLRAYGVPLEYWALIWFAAMLAVEVSCTTTADGMVARLAAYEWWLGVAGVAATIWLAKELWRSRLIATAAWPYWAACWCVVLLFLRASLKFRVGDPPVLKHVPTDATRVLSRPATWLLACATMLTLAFGPRSLDMPTTGAAFARWFASQPRVSVPKAWRRSPITLVELIDYQCPVCRTAEREYRGVLEDAARDYGPAFCFLTVDFPLDNQCNPPRPGATGDGLHPAACEAAAAVRLAQRSGRGVDQSVRDWLWAHQDSLTPEFVFSGIETQFGLDVRAHFSEMLQLIRADVEAGRAVRASSTPTYFLNGKKLGLVPPQTLRAAIAIEAAAHKSGARKP